MDKKNSISKLKRIIVLVLVLLLIGAGAVGIGLAMRLRLPEQAVVCGVNVSDMLAADAEMLLEDKVSTYAMNVVVGDQSFVITAEDLGIKFQKDNFETVVRSMVDTGAGADPWSVISIDQDKLASYVDATFDEKRGAPVSPNVLWNESVKCFSAVAGEPETWYSREILTGLVYEAVASLTTELEIDEAQLYQERIDTEKEALAVSLAQRANELMALELELVFNPRKVEVGREVIGSDAIASFLRFDLENGTVYVDDDTVLAYVEEFAPNYVYSKYKDRFVTHGGDRVKTKVQVEDQTVDVEATVSLIVDCITQGTSGSFEVPYAGALNFSGTYIEVSIPEQRLWYYRDGEVLLESDVVTGNEGIRRYTPTGVNYIRGHLTNIYLLSDYYVEYWMSFTTGGLYGFHDADHWRQPEEYGGDTYKTRGSSGCVNVPVAKMAELYELVEDGTPVMIYNYFHYDGY